MSASPALRLHDTASRSKRLFAPIDPARVRMYVCGPTVYDFAHIGNARPVIVFDLLFRLLRTLHGADHVVYVRNLTDVDDKINARAARDYPDLPLNQAIAKVTALTEAQFHEDVDALGCLRPSIEPRATEHIAEMKAIIGKLVAGGHAYVAEEHVLFNVPSMPAYGQLSHRPLEDMQAGARVEVAPYKRDAMDFVLWKPSKSGEPAWESPCGIATPGRPGWHIECSAMSWKHLGETFDIHGGGIDLVFPHHENEVAQTCSAFHTDVMANIWMHNGFLMVEGEKMSKSLGNFITIRDVLKDWPGDVVRLNMLRIHYRQPIDWTVKGLEESARVLDGFVRATDGVVPAAELPAGFVEALSDDLNTPKALAELHGLRNEAARNPEAAAGLAAALAFLGIRPEDLVARRAAAAPAALPDDEIRARIDARAAAKKGRNFAEADRIRDELAGLGIVLKDSKDGTTWEVKT